MQFTVLNILAPINSLDSHSNLLVYYYSMLRCVMQTKRYGWIAEDPTARKLCVMRDKYFKKELVLA